MIRLVNIKKHFGQAHTRVDVLKGITVEFKAGKTYALTGVSGTGKSTLMHIIAGLEKPSSGHIFFNDQDITHFTAEQHRQFLHGSVGLVFQSPYLIGELTVLENVILKGFIGAGDGATCKKKGLELLERVGLAHKAHSAPATLSGGEQQRVALARALFERPLFVLADEPTAHLDEGSRASIIKLLLELHHTQGMGLIVSSHDTFVAQAMDVIFEIHDGLLTTQKEK